MARLIYIIFFTLLTCSSIAQKFVASASKTKVAVGEQFEVTFTFTGSGSSFRPPSFADFNVYFGPSQSSSVQIINGNMSQSIGFSYVMAGKREGKFTIGPASIISNGNKIESNSLTIEVIKGASSAQGQGGDAGGISAKDIENNLFVKTNLSSKKVYLGEQITVTHKIYTRLNLKGLQDVKFPEYNGFYSQDYSKQGQVTLESENIDGIIFNVAELKKVFLFPQRTGKIELEPIEVECIVREQASRRPQSVFDQLFGMGTYEDKLYKVKSKPLTIEVLPLPEKDKPENFSGAVGEFNFKAQIDKEKLKANEAANIKITVTGKGNLKLLESPSITFPEDIETYDPKIKEDIVVTSYGASGTKTFEYLIIPRHQGEYKIENINFNYFNPEKKSYITLPPVEFTLQVEKGEESAGSAVTSAIKNDVKQLGDDIRYIKTSGVELKSKGEHFFDSGLFAAGICVPILSFIGFLVLRRKHIEANKDIAGVKSRQANKMARKRLVAAEKYLKKNEKENFYNELYVALYGYLSDRLNIPVADLSKENITANLSKRNVDEVTIANLNETLQNCEFAKYAPAAVSSNLQQVYNNTVNVITKLEANLK